MKKKLSELSDTELLLWHNYFATIYNRYKEESVGNEALYKLFDVEDEVTKRKDKIDFKK